VGAGPPPHIYSLIALRGGSGCQYCPPLLIPRPNAQPVHFPGVSDRHQTSNAPTCANGSERCYLVHMWSARLACYLTCCCIGGFELLSVFADVVAGGGPAILRPGRPARAWLSGFRSAREDGQGAVDGPEPAAEAGGGEPAWPAGLLPGQPAVHVGLISGRTLDHARLVPRSAGGPVPCLLRHS
jgi:hypothetical protein